MKTFKQFKEEMDKEGQEYIATIEKDGKTYSTPTRIIHTSEGPRAAPRVSSVERSPEGIPAVVSKPTTSSDTK